MKKKFFGVLFAVLLLSLVVVPVSAGASPQPLVAVGEPKGNEASIVVEFEAGMTLGQLESMSWMIYTTEGYPAHLDITLATTDPDQSMLTAEMAYNNAQGKELDSDPSLTTFIAYDEWMETFELTSEDGFSAIGDTTMFWVTKMGAGNDDAPWGTLADWKAGNVINDPDPEGAELSGGTEISASTVITKLEIEVDNWVLDTVVYVDNILLNTGPTVGLSVVTIPAPDIVAVSVTPTSIDFGTLYPGQSSSTTVVTVENVGTVTINVDASVEPTPTVFDNLLIGSLPVPTSGLIPGLVGGSSSVVDIQLVVPADYSAKGVETATLVFSATAVE